MALFGLIGHPLGHSYSKDYFTDFFAANELRDHRYELFDLQNLALLPALLKNENPSGLNVTIPYKKEIFRYLHYADPVAEEIGAVNCIVVSEGLHLSGYNTDYSAFRECINKLGISKNIHALILGTGGASNAVAAVLRHMSISHHLISRGSAVNQLTYSDLTKEIIESHQLIINCTPAGMWPDTGIKPDFPCELIGPDHLVFDLIYNPAETELMKRCREQGARVQNGLEMFYLQARHSWNIWTMNQ
jgi:shikimate dehydrogenase